jgi:hypothetical protein
MTVIYEDARAWAEDRAAELEYHAKKHPADHGAVRDAARFRSLLAGPPEPSVEDVARVIDPDLFSDEEVTRHRHASPFTVEVSQRSVLDLAAKVHAIFEPLFRSRRNG